MAKKTAKRKDTQKKSPSFEDALAQLEEIAERLEEGDLPLAEAMDGYERGVKLLKSCFGELEKAERRIELVSGVDEQGQPVTTDFDEGSQSLDEKATTRSRRRSSSPRSSRRDVDEANGLF